MPRAAITFVAEKKYGLTEADCRFDVVEVHAQQARRGRTGGQLIPNIVHFTFGMSGRDELPFSYFINVLAATLRLRPEKIYIPLSPSSARTHTDALRPLLTFEQHEDFRFFC